METTTENLTTPPKPKSAAGGSFSQPAGYVPSVGDRFHKPAGKAINNKGETVETPEHNAEVTMISPGHVVVVIDAIEYTLKLGDFVHLAAKTLASGSTLIRGHNVEVSCADKTKG